jgi:NADH-quinone oxidoreductase subunit L
MHEEQDMRRMGGLRKFMPITAGTFIVGWLAIAGVPPFAGFWSKDEILLYAYDANPVLWALGLITALLTAFYMSRQVFMVFFGDERWRHTDAGATSEAAASAEAVAADEPGHEPATVHADADAGHGDEHGGLHGREPHESPWLMTAPLVVLAALAILGGGLNLPFSPDLHVLGHWLEPVLEGNEAHIDVATGTKVGLAAIAIAASLGGIVLAALVYLKRRFAPVVPEILADGWHYDRAISAFMGGPGRAGFEGAATFDRTVVDGAVNGVATLVRGGGKGLRVVQSGYVRSYALGVAVGVVALVGYFLTRASF